MMLNVGHVTLGKESMELRNYCYIKRIFAPQFGSFGRIHVMFPENNVQSAGGKLNQVLTNSYLPDDHRPNTV